MVPTLPPASTRAPGHAPRWGTAAAVEARGAGQTDTVAPPNSVLGAGRIARVTLGPDERANRSVFSGDLQHLRLLP